MKTCLFIIAAAATLVMVGCRTDPRITMLERENRLLEDEIWRLRGALEGRGRCDSVDGPNLITPRQSDTGSGATPGGLSIPWSLPGAAPGAGGTPPGMTEVTPEEALESLEKKSSQVPQPPDVDPPLPVVTPPQDQPDEVPREPHGMDERSSSIDSGKVALITLNETLCGGYNADGRPGDEGIRLVLQPRNAHGRVLTAPGHVVVVVLDPALEGEAARVGRWDFSADEVARRFRSGGVMLETLWPPVPPRHNDLHLFVRYTTRDGRHIETDCPIRVAAPGEIARHRPPTEPRPMPARTAAEPAQLRFVPESTGPISTTRRPKWSPYRDRP